MRFGTKIIRNVHHQGVRNRLGILEFNPGRVSSLFFRTLCRKSEGERAGCFYISGGFSPVKIPGDNFPFLDSNQTLQIIPDLASMNVELGRTYTLLCRSNDPGIEPEWTYENGTVITPSMFSVQQ